MNATLRNNDLVEAAIAYVRRFDDVLGHQPRFDIHFEGFGTGGTAGVTAESAVKYLHDLASPEDPHYRYRTVLKSLSVKAYYPTYMIS